MTDESQVKQAAKRPTTLAIETWGTLNDHAVIPVVIADIDRDLEVKMRAPDAMDVLQIEMDYPLPDPPIVVGRDGLPHFNDKDPGYLRETNRARIRRQERQVILTLVTPSVPGETLEEQVAALQKLPAHIYHGLRDMAEQLCYSRRARVEERAHKFQPNGAADHGDPGAVSPDAGTVAADEQPGQAPAVGSAVVDGAAA